MAITINDSRTNNADWKPIFRFTDKATGDLLDFTGADISVEIWDQNNCKRLDASTDNTKIAILGLGRFQVRFTAEEMGTLCPGSYNMGGIFFLNNETNSLFTGKLSVRRGYSSL